MKARLVCAMLVALPIAGCSRPTPVMGITTDPAIRLASPVPCAVIKSWQGDMLDMDGNRRSEAHRGLDIVAPAGTPVIAAAPGKVIYRDTQWAGGKSILLWHGADAAGNRVISYYAHMSELNAEKDEVVRRGQLIGRVGNSGHNMPRSMTPHLHFEVLVYPEDAPRFLFGWLRNFTTVSPNYFVHPLPRIDGKTPGENMPAVFAKWIEQADYGDLPGGFTGFTFPMRCPARGP